MPHAIPLPVLTRALIALEVAESELRPNLNSKAWEHVMRARVELQSQLSMLEPRVIPVNNTTPTP